MIGLLAGDGVADLGRSGTGELAHGGRLVHFSDGEGTYGVHDGAKDLATGGVFDFTDLAIDCQVVTDFHTVFGADVNDDGAIGRDVGDQARDLYDLHGGGRHGGGLLVDAVGHVGG